MEDLLPADVLANILARLPVESLAQAKYVSKRWHSTIVRNPSFARLHLDFASRKNNNPSLIVLYTHLFGNLDKYKPLCDLFLLDLDQPHHHDGYTHHLLPLPTEFHRSDREYDLVGSCNGILCFAIKHCRFPGYLCNPVLGEYLTLPFYPEWRELVDSVMYSPCVTGFGCDPVTGDYKVVKIYLPPQPEQNDYYDSAEEDYYVEEVEPMMQCMVCTVTCGGEGADDKDQFLVWREIGDVPYPIEDSQGVVVNGSLHWLAKHDPDVDLDISECVVSFDLHNENFRAVPTPAALDPATKVYMLGLGVIGGCLSLFDTTYAKRLDIWVMKEYGNVESWVKEYTMKRRGSTNYPNGDFYTPSCLWNEDEVLIERRMNDFLSYDPRSSTIREVEICGGLKKLLNAYAMINSIPHVCSIVSLKNAPGGAKGNVKKLRKRNKKRHNKETIGRWDTTLHPWPFHKQHSPRPRDGPPIPVVRITDEMLVDEYEEEL